VTWLGQDLRSSDSYVAHSTTHLLERSSGGNDDIFLSSLPPMMCLYVWEREPVRVQGESLAFEGSEGTWGELVVFRVGVLLDFLSSLDMCVRVRVLRVLCYSRRTTQDKVDSCHSWGLQAASINSEGAIRKLR
jgi:hypothetical protein